MYDKLFLKINDKEKFSIVVTTGTVTVEDICGFMI